MPGGGRGGEGWGGGAGLEDWGGEVGGRVAKRGDLFVLYGKRLSCCN